MNKTHTKKPIIWLLAISIGLLVIGDSCQASLSQMVYVGNPPLEEKSYITNNVIKVSIIYIYSKTSLVPNWRNLLTPSLDLTEDFYSKYTSYSFQWNLYEIYAPDLDPLAEDYSIYNNYNHANDALPAFYRSNPAQAESILSNSNIMFVYINSRVGGVIGQTIYMNAINNFQTLDNYQRALTISHEIAHTFGAKDLYAYIGNPYYNPFDPDNEYDIMANGVFTPSGTQKFGTRSLSYLHFNYALKDAPIAAFLLDELARLFFHVKDASSPISGATITVSGASTTTTNGEATFTGVNGSPFSYSINKAGYKTESGSGVFNGDLNIYKTLTLNTSPWTPPEPVIIETYKGITIKKYERTQNTFTYEFSYQGTNYSNNSISAARLKIDQLTQADLWTPPDPIYIGTYKGIAIYQCEKTQGVYTYEFNYQGTNYSFNSSNEATFFIDQLSITDNYTPLPLLFILIILSWFIFSKKRGR